MTFKHIILEMNGSKLMMFDTCTILLHLQVRNKEIIMNPHFTVACGDIVVKHTMSSGKRYSDFLCSTCA